MLPSIFSFSLRMIFVCVAFSALGIAAIVNGTETWLTVVTSLSLFSSMVAVSVATNAKASRRAFAIGFISWGLIYLAFVGFFLKNELRGEGKLVTTRLLQVVYAQISKPILINNAPGYPAMRSSHPPFETFAEIGHIVWAWLFALIGGILGQAMFVSGHSTEPRINNRE